MANRYWVGGTAAWDGTAGTKWALTSGGAGGQAIPTSADDVFFDAASGANTVTISTGNTGAKSITCTGFTGTLAGTAAISVAGSVTLVAGQTVTYSGILTLTATGTLTTGGKTLGAVTVDTVGGTVTLGSALTSSGAVTITNGTFTTSASNYSVTALSFVSSNSNTRAVTLNASTITLSTGGSAWNIGTSSGMTFTRGTSSIVLSGISPSFQGGNLTYYNVSFTGTIAGTSSISGSNTFNQLTLTAPASAGVTTVTFGGTQTITTFVCSGASAVRRIMLQSDTLGTARTLTITTWATVTDVDFMDITLTNAKSGTRLGNCGGNTNITFDAAKNVYWNLAGAQNWSATGWATSSGGAPAVNNFPLAQDTAVFNNAGSVTGTITNDAKWNVGTVDMSTRTTAMTLSFPLNLMSVYGNWSNGTGTTISGGAVIQFAGRTTQTITSNGVSFSNQIAGIGVSNTITLADALTCSDLFSLAGTTGLNLGNNTLTANYFQNYSTSLRTLAFGTGNITVTGSNGFGIFSNLLAVSGTPVVNVTYSGASAMNLDVGALSEAFSISFNFTAGTYALAFSPANTVRNLNFTGFSGSYDPAVSSKIFGNLTLSSGMTFSGTNAVTLSATSGTKTITSNGKAISLIFIIDGAGGTFQLQDAFNVNNANGMALVNGTLNLNGQTATVTTIGTQTGTKNLTFNGGTLIFTNSGAGAFNNAAPTGFTTTAGTGTGTIRMNAATAKTFIGGGSTFNCTLDQGGAGALTITGANTFSNITNTYGSTGATSILFTAGTTTTFTDWNASGTSGKLLTIGSVTAASHTLSKSTGTVSANYLSISRSTATGGATWYAGASSTNGGNNTGWIFTSASSASGNFLMFFM